MNINIPYKIIQFQPKSVRQCKEKTNKNNSKNGIDITSVEVPAKDNMISMNFGNADVLTVKSAKQKQELNVSKTQLLRTGQRTNSMYKVQMQ